jgi:hypothetical protein
MRGYAIVPPRGRFYSHTCKALDLKRFRVGLNETPRRSEKNPPFSFAFMTTLEMRIQLGGMRFQLADEEKH